MGEQPVVVVVGAGGMGVACARRLAPGRRLLLADAAADRLDEALAVLSADGYDVTARPVDVSDHSSVQELAAHSEAAGRLRTLVHTAGLSPTMASGRRILEVDLLGTAQVLDAFRPLAGPDTVAVCIASLAGHLFAPGAETEARLATAPTADLLDATGLHLDTVDAATAYGVAKRGNQLRVQAAAADWGRAGARVVSISPGIIATAMGRREQQQQAAMADLLRVTPLARVGTADEVAAAVEWLASPAASFVTGTDLLLDGGVAAALRWGG